VSLVSVVIPTYNRTELLCGRALPSVLNQSHADIEVIVVGDGTEPQTAERIEELGDSRVRFYNLPRFQYPEDQHLRWGLSGLVARNYGLDRAKGEFVAALDDDDAMLPDAIEVLMAAMTDDVDFVYGLSETFKNGRSIGQLYGRYPPGDGALCNGAYVYRASLPYRFDTDCFSRGLTGDADMWTRMVTGGVRFRLLPKIVHQYHRNFP
jgi:glycosyltransferase involved in cell wall biosynthesis